MAIFEKMAKATAERDAEIMVACLHDDFEFIRHQTGTTMDKAQTSAMFRGFMASEDVVVQSQRCVYENDEVLIEHTVMDFADGSREAVLACHTLKDGLILRTETGATPIKPA